LRFTKLKGRNNYLCRDRFYKLLRGETGNLSPRERNAVLPLVVWSQYTETGDIEEQTFFNPKWFFKTWNMISADGQDCSGRRCPHHAACFLQKARALAQTSHIVVINHALFYSDVCSETSFLGAIGSIIFDEAHHLESSGHQHLRTELDTNRFTAFTDKLQNLQHTASNIKGHADAAAFEKDLKNHLKHIRKRSQDLLSELDRWASSNDPNSKADYQIAINEDSLRRLLEPAMFDIALGDLQDTFHHFRQILSAERDNDRFDGLREETQACAEQTSQLRADMQYLVAAKTPDHVFWAEGNHEKKWAKLCGVPLDISELLTPIWERASGGIAFTSATLATQGTTDYFKRAAGLEPLADKTTSIILPSPYGADQMLFGAFRNCPEPDHPAFAQFAADVIANIHSRLGKNVLVLFTSNAMLNNVSSCLKSMANVDRNNILAQGQGASRNAILEQFKTQSGMILLGTDSFWEGVDAPGKSCEAVVIPRLPFPVPTHPLTQALGSRMETLYGNSFFSYSVPEAVIKFRQGIGRLIRSADDRGALVVLDNRIITKGYGKQFVSAVRSPINEFEDVRGMIDKMRDFFDGGPQARAAKNDADEPPISNIRYVPFEDL
jgi:Rad3-related DNA helicase